MSIQPFNSGMHNYFQRRAEGLEASLEMAEKINRVHQRLLLYGPFIRLVWEQRIYLSKIKQISCSFTPLIDPAPIFAVLVDSTSYYFPLDPEIDEPELILAAECFIYPDAEEPDLAPARIFQLLNFNRNIEEPRFGRRNLAPLQNFHERGRRDLPQPQNLLVNWDRAPARIPDENRGLGIQMREESRRIGEALDRIFDEAHQNREISQTLERRVAAIEAENRRAQFQSGEENRRVMELLAQALNRNDQERPARENIPPPPYVAPSQQQSAPFSKMGPLLALIGLVAIFWSHYRLTTDRDNL